MKLEDYLKQLRVELNDDSFQSMLTKIRETIDADGTIFLCGNGGSGSTASHFTNDLGKLVAHTIGHKIKAISLSADPVMLTTLGNDCGYEAIFREQLHNLARPGDLLIAFSGSGNSPNVVRAMEWCQRNDVYTIGMTGQIEPVNILAETADLAFVVPSDSMQVIEDIHLMVTHALCIGLMNDATV